MIVKHCKHLVENDFEALKGLLDSEFNAHYNSEGFQMQSIKYCNDDLFGP